MWDTSRVHLGTHFVFIIYASNWCYFSKTQNIISLLHRWYTNIYACKKGSNHSLWPLLTYLNDLKTWLAANFLHLKEGKTEIVVFAPSNVSESPWVDLGSLSIYFKSMVKNLGVIFDNSLKFDKQVNAVVRSSFFQLRTLTKVKSFLSFEDLERVMHAFVTSCLDYCNALYAGINQSTLRHFSNCSKCRS